MRPSARMESVQSPIIPIVRDLIRANPGTISLGQGVVGYGPPREATDRIALFLADPEKNKYQPVPGIPELLEAVRSKLAAENGVFVGPERKIVVTAGANMAFMNALLAIADPGDEVILLKPYYFNYDMAVRMASCRPVVVPTTADYQPDLEAIRRAWTPRTRAVVTISPNNPTGAVYPEDTVRAVNALCGERGAYHVHDEAYEYFTWGTTPHFSPGAIRGAEGWTISLFSMSKTYGFASWRVGYMVIPEHLFEAVRKVQDTILICAPAISQEAAVGALKAGADYCRGKLGEIRRLRNLALETLRPLRHFCHVSQAEGAFYLFLRLDTGLADMEVVERLIREFRVAVIPGSAFGVADACCLRVSYGALRAQEAAEGLGRLARGLTSIVRGSP